MKSGEFIVRQKSAEVRNINKNVQEAEAQLLLRCVRDVQS